MRISDWHLLLACYLIKTFSSPAEVKAKATVQQWAQYRYGVFEEHGYPNDKILPYFYRHPDGYDAVTSSNNTIIKGDLIRSVKHLLIRENFDFMTPY